LKIAINTRLLIKNKLEGIGYFIFETLKIITRDHPEHQFFFLFDRDYDEDFIFADNITPIVLKPQARHPILYFIWFEYSVTSILKKLEIDVFLSPDGYLPLRSKIPSIAVFHDLNFEHHPEDYPFLERSYYKYFFPRYAKKAARLATVSEFSREDIINKYQTNPDHIDVVNCGVRSSFKPLNPEEIQKTKKEFSEHKDYFIYVGSIQSRKNIANLIRAFNLYKRITSSDDKLLLVGASKWTSKELKNAYRNSPYKGDIQFTGRVNDEKISRLMASAKALLLVSKLEGFGIPIVEAFHCEVAVITSNITSMPEVAGEAALLVDPNSIDSIAKAMISLNNNDLIQTQLINKARIQRQKYSWQKTADLLWKSIEKVNANS
jgi:glycosyltransferase involved in cell wall biosynthesis